MQEFVYDIEIRKKEQPPLNPLLGKEGSLR